MSGLRQMDGKWFTLTIVRHGETTANKSRIIQGQTDFELNDTGINQARKLGDFFNRNNHLFDHVFSSDLSRASTTCQLIVGHSKQILMEPRLRERHFSVLEGKHVDFFLKQAEENGFTGKRLPMYTPKGGETIEDVGNRVREFCDTILVKHVTPNSNVLIVTHGGVFIEFMKYAEKYLHCDFNGQNAMRIPLNTSFTVFKIEYNESKLLRAFCESLHRNDHLKENLEDKVGLAC